MEKSQKNQKKDDAKKKKTSSAVMNRAKFVVALSSDQSFSMRKFRKILHKRLNVGLLKRFILCRQLRLGRNILFHCYTVNDVTLTLFNSIHLSLVKDCGPKNIKSIEYVSNQSIVRSDVYGLAYAYNRAPTKVPMDKESGKNRIKYTDTRIEIKIFVKHQID